MGQRKQWGHVKGEQVAPRVWKIPHNREDMAQEQAEEDAETERKMQELREGR